MLNVIGYGSGQKLMTRASSSLQVQRDQYKTTELTRVKRVEKQLQARPQFKSSTDKPSFICHELFGRHERAKQPFFHYQRPKIPRLNWFLQYPINRLNPKLISAQRKEIAEVDINELYNLVHKFCPVDEPNDLTQSTLNQLDIIKAITYRNPMDAVVITNHMAAVDMIHNFSTIALETSDLIVPCYFEFFADQNGLQFKTTIEEFGENVVVNGVKSYVSGAEKASHFLAFVSTMVKERNGKLYKRLSVVLIPANTPGVSIVPHDEMDALFYRLGLDQVVFEDVEIQPDWVIGRIGFGKEYLTHFQDCQNLFTSKIANTILDKNLKKLIKHANATEYGDCPLSARDILRRVVANVHLEVISLSSMIAHVAERRGYLFTEVRPELNAAKVTSNGLLQSLESIYDFYSQELTDEQKLDVDLLIYLSKLSESDPVLLTNIGYAGFNALYGLNQNVLKGRVGSMWFTPNALFAPWYWYRRGAQKMYWVRNPKLYDWQLDFIYGENKIYRSPTSAVRIPSFTEQFDFNGQVFSDRLMDLFELHGDDINKDEFIVSTVAGIAVKYFKLGALYSYLNHHKLLEEYNDILIKEILSLEPQMINRTATKYQLSLEVLENIVELPVTSIPKQLEFQRKYLPSPPLMIENTYIENEKFLSNIEKLKLLDAKSEELLELKKDIS